MKKTFKMLRYGNIDTNIFNDTINSDTYEGYLALSLMEKIPVLGFDLSELSDRWITNAVLKVKVESDYFPIELDISTLTHEWDEKGVSIYNSCDKTRWTGDKLFTDYIMGNGNSRHFRSEMLYDQVSMIGRINITPQMIHSIAVGESHGLCLLDYKSRLYDDTNVFCVKLFNADDETGPVPELEIEYGDEQYVSEEANKTDSHWSISDDKVPLPPVLESNISEDIYRIIEGKQSSLYLVDEFCKVDPVSGDIYGNAHTQIRELCNFENNKPLQFTGIPGEKLSFTCVIENRSEEAKIYTLNINENNINEQAITINKIWYAAINNKWYPEAAIPSDKTCNLKIPFTENCISGQTYQAVNIDIVLDHDIEPGDYRFNLNCREDSFSCTIQVRITVEDIKPGKLPFELEMIGYTPLPVYEGIEYGKESYGEVEQAYYKTALDHDMYVNILPYRHNGTVHPGFLPGIEYRNGMPAITDWSEWDNHFGKYIDGSYALERYGKQIPVTRMYIPVHENWPMRMEDYYKIRVSTNRYPEMVNEARLKTTTIENDFEPGYREGIKKIFIDFIRHFDEKGWNDTKMTFYLNNKYYWRNRNDRRRYKEYISMSTGKFIGGTSWWCLDEPVTRDDWEAVHYFGEILKEAKEETGSGDNFVYRVDISRYHLMFGSVDGLMDLAVINKRALELNEGTARKRRQEFGEEYWSYGDIGRMDRPLTDGCLNVIDTYLKGGTGYIPWDNYGWDFNYEKPGVTSSFYPGKRFGLKEPVVSLRLKAYRKGIQIVKYLELLKKRLGYSDEMVDNFVDLFIQTHSKTVFSSDEDAGGTRFSMIGYEQLDKLKFTVIDILRSNKNTE